MSNLAEIVRADAASSDNRWDGAVESAERDGDKAAGARWETERAKCAEHYDAAIEAIESGDLDLAESELERANELESSAGDNADAHHALKAVRAAVEATP
jgi:hypothetical protein